MKNIIYPIFLIIFFLACSNPVEPTLIINDTEEPIIEQSKFNPPEWIIGNWQDDGYVDAYDHTFNETNIILKWLLCPMIQNFIYLYEYRSLDDIDEIITENYYKIVIRGNSCTEVYLFTKINNMTISWAESSDYYQSHDGIEPEFIDYVCRVN